MYKNVATITTMQYLSKLWGTVAYRSQPQKLAED